MNDNQKIQQALRRAIDTQKRVSFEDHNIIHPLVCAGRPAYGMVVSVETDGNVIFVKTELNSRDGDEGGIYTLPVSLLTSTGDLWKEAALHNLTTAVLECQLEVAKRLKEKAALESSLSSLNRCLTMAIRDEKAMREKLEDFQSSS